MRLTIAEKPQIAFEIARVLGAHSRAEGYCYGANEIVTWVVGHLIELAPPEDYDPAYGGKWRRDLPPIIPTEFRYRVQERTEDQFNVIKSLLSRSDITEVVNACDAAREGELIFALVCHVAGYTRPYKRLWMQSNTDDDIRPAYESLRPSSEYAGLLAAAHARQQSDWLIGINATRALSLAANTGRSYSLGRVITPTLALVVARDEAIENFKPLPFYELTATFKGQGSSSYKGFYFRSSPDEGGAQEKRVARFNDKADADGVAAQLTSAAHVVSANEREVETKPPLLFDLTQLQRAASNHYQFSLKTTLDAAQILWDAKLVTYPRSASQHLSTALNAQIISHLQSLAGISTEPYAHLQQAARFIIDNQLSLTTRHVDDKKLTEGHHAIIPSTAKPDLSKLPGEAQKIYDLIARRFLAVFFPAARDARTEIITSCGGHLFITRGTRPLSDGWRAIDPPARSLDHSESAQTDDAEQNASLPKLTQGESVNRDSFDVLQKKTRAPERYTEISLVEAMESAGHLCENEEERLAMKVCGLGTVATRTNTIMREFKLGYLERDGKRFLRSTAVGREVVRRLRAIKSVLVSPAMTGKWEAELSRIANGECDATAFNAGVINLTRHTVEKIFAQADNAPNSNQAFLEAASAGACPECQRSGRAGRLRIRESANGKFFGCSEARETCGYTSGFTSKAKELKALLETHCSLCQCAMRLVHSKDKKTAFLVCADKSCKGVLFFDKPKKRLKKL